MQSPSRLKKRKEFIMLSSLSDAQIAEKIKGLAKEHNTTVPSLVTEIVQWALTRSNFDVTKLDFEQAKKRGRAVSVDRVAKTLDKYSPQQLLELEQRIRDMRNASNDNAGRP
jgi:hypothetical protein